jgi:hypothetical protein
MKPNGKWSFYLDDEDYGCQDWFDDENDALIAGMEEAKKQDANTIMVGKVNTFRPAAGDYADDLLEYLQDAACDECGAEDWLDDVTHADLRDLGVFLDDAFVRWLDKHPEYKPGFYTLTDLRLFDKEGEPLD